MCLFSNYFEVHDLIYLCVPPLYNFHSCGLLKSKSRFKFHLKVTTAVLWELYIGGLKMGLNELKNIFLLNVMHISVLDVENMIVRVMCVTNECCKSKHVLEHFGDWWVF